MLAPTSTARLDTLRTRPKAIVCDRVSVAPGALHTGGHAQSISQIA
jgi:hypothetical protein